MKKSKLFFVLLLILPLFLMLFLSDTITAEIYKWVDENGITHYADHLPQDAGLKKKTKEIPTYNIKPQSSIKYDDGKGDSGGRSYGTTINEEESQPLIKHNVELYITSWCRYCKKARKFFQSRGIPIIEYDIEKDSKAALRKRRLDSRRGVPFAVINGHRIHGYIPSAYERALKDGS